MKDINNITCVQCGKEGFARTTVKRNNITVTALECNNCKAILFEHEVMMQLTKKSKGLT